MLTLDTIEYEFLGRVLYFVLDQDCIENEDEKTFAVKLLNKMIDRMTDLDLIEKAPEVYL